MIINENFFEKNKKIKNLEEELLNNLWYSEFFEELIDETFKELYLDYAQINDLVTRIVHNNEY
jgi:hypothetical protein